MNQHSHLGPYNSTLVLQGSHVSFGVQWNGSPLNDIQLFVQVKESGHLIQHCLFALVCCVLVMDSW